MEPINSLYFPMKQTRKNLFERSKEIMAATELTREKKVEMVRSAAAGLIEEIFHRTTEGRDFWKRNAAAEKRLAGHNGFSYCPHDGEWSPNRPPEIKALDQEYVDLTHRMTDEAFRKALGRKAA
jgi:hypothetical protein